jgi:hypothetical protein
VSTGFVEKATFDRLLKEADVVLALTTREATMQRAGYEALYNRRPLVCSDRRVLVEAFRDAAVTVPNEGPAIAAGVRRALREADVLIAAIEPVLTTMLEQAAISVSDLRTRERVTSLALDATINERIA